jgi:predicted nucleic acid-binding protein
MPSPRRTTIAGRVRAPLKGKDPIPEGHREKVRKFFRHAWIRMRELDRAIAGKAQEVVWTHNVRPKDAVHVATADCQR